MKHLLPTLLAACTLPASAVEQILLDWNATWSYFHPMSDDPSLDDAAIPNAGGGTAPNIGPDLIHTGFNSGAGAWFAKQSDFTAPGGYASVFGKGFNLDGTFTGNTGNYSTYDGGAGPGPFGYEQIVYFTTGGAEMTGFGTTLTQPAANRRFASYYRTTFTASQDYTKPRVRLLLDDNAIIFYDGVLVARVNRTTNGIAYNDVGSTDTNATNNETGTSAGNENVIQSFRLDVAGGPDSTATAGATADSFVVSAIPKITAGTHTLAVIVRNSGNNSSDMVFGMQLRGDDAGLSAEVTNVVRTDGGTPLDVSDDTYSFDVKVTTINMPGATTWTSDNAPANGPTTGSYGTTYTFTYPAQANNSAPVNTNTITFADSVNTAVTTSVIVTSPEAPNGPPLVLAPATPSFGTDFEEPPVGTQVHNRKIYQTGIGFTSNAGSGPVSNGGITRPGGVYQDPVHPETNKTWRAVNGACTLTTEAIGLDPSVKALRVSMKVRAFTTSGTTFEAIDAVSLAVETSPNGLVWNHLGNVLPILIGSPDSTNQQNLDRIITLIGPGASNTNTLTYATLTRQSMPVGAGAAFVRLRYTNAADLSTSENILLDDLLIQIASLDPDADADGDGWSNAAEDAWGSDIYGSSSRPGINSHSLAQGPNPGELTKTIQISTGSPFYTYTFRVSDDLVNWTETTFPGIDDPMVRVFTSTSPRRFFQVRSNY